MRDREMGGFPCESESWVSSSSITSIPENDTAFELVSLPETTGFLNQDEEWAKLNFANKNNLNMNNNNGSSLKKKKKNQVLLEWYVEAADDDDLSRTKSLTDDDLDELKGCLDLGFGFSYEEIPELCNTLPALELCYSMSQKFMDDQQKSPPESAQAPATDSCSSVSSPIANWKISSPGESFGFLLFFFIIIFFLGKFGLFFVNGRYCCFWL